MPDVFTVFLNKGDDDDDDDPDPGPVPAPTPTPIPHFTDTLCFTH